MTGLDQLPAELYAAVVDHLCPGQERQSSLASLLLAIPRSPVSDHLLYEEIYLTHRKQAPLLYRTLRQRKGDALRVRVFSYHCWQADAPQVVNVVSLLKNVRELSLWIGTDFSPEDLEEMFDKPRDDLLLLSLRFRPYVRRATYYQFMAGAYFDSTIERLSQWPRASLPSLSIVQEPLPKAEDGGNTESFAQPFVFFHLQPVRDLAASPYVSTVRSLRFRVPTRFVARQLCGQDHVLPSVELLDLSTTRLSTLDLETLVSRLACLQHLVLDGCPLMPTRDGPLEVEDMGPWQSLGVLLAVASMQRSKTKERQYKAWAQGGRKKPAGGNAAKPAHLSLALGGLSIDNSSAELPERIHIIPPIPTISSFAITVPMFSPAKEDFDADSRKVREAFARGWENGLHRMTEKRTRIRNSWARLNAVVYKMDPQDHAFTVPLNAGTSNVGNVGNVMHGLTKVEDIREFDLQPPPCPVLCLVGPGRHNNHPEGCSHRVAWGMWSDEL